MSYWDVTLDKIVGKKIEKIQFNEDFLVFHCSDGTVAKYTINSNYYSHSYFHDFHGVKNLLESDKVLSFTERELSLTPEQTLDLDHDRYDYIQVYGFTIVAEHPTWGDITAVFSFRNRSNGYYGGSMYDTDVNTDNVPYITDYVLETGVERND